MLKKFFIWIICKTLPSCKEMTELVSRSLETKLSQLQTLKIKLHLWSCAACRQYLFQLKFMSKIFQLQEEKIKVGKNLPTLTPDTVERLKDALKSTKFLLAFAMMNFLQ